MESPSVCDLAMMLRDAGKVNMNKSIKLTLTEDVLVEVINSFNLINEQKEAMSSSFHIMQNTNEKTNTFSDSQFLYEFFQKVPTLKLSGDHMRDNVIDISYFKWLKHLEICNINLERIQGLQSLKDILEVLICTRNITEIKEIFSRENDDLYEELLWIKLRAAYISHNFITSIDNGFQFTPYLHTLDLSFNSLEDVDNLNYLHNLKNLNIAYNKLKQAPNFCGVICHKLQVLNLKYNFIECVLGLSLLVNLRELDLSNNFILKHDALVPMANILSLQSLKLDGNPISYHPHHRNHTCQYLNHNTATVAFYLDGKLMSYKEKSIVGSIHPKNNSQRTHLASQSSAVESIATDKPRRIREATISDENEAPNTLNESVSSVSSIVTSQEHLETKRNLEKLREKLGEKWLLGESTAGHSSPKKSPQFSSTPYEDVLIHAKEFVLSNDTFHDAIEVVTGSTLKESSSETFKEANSTTPTEADPYFDGDVSDTSSDSLINIGTGDDDLYLVTRVGESEQIFLVVTENFLAERDVTVNAKEHYRWDSEGLVSCKLEEDVIYLEFDRLRADYKQRQYVVEDAEERERLVRVLTNFIKKRPAQKTTTTVYQCLKCNGSFKIAQKTDCVECPSCESNLVIEQKPN